VRHLVPPKLVSILVLARGHARGSRELRRRISVEQDRRPHCETTVEYLIRFHAVHDQRYLSFDLASYS
jgi:hypothetical protein